MLNDVQTCHYNATVILGRVDLLFVAVAGTFLMVGEFCSVDSYILWLLVVEFLESHQMILYVFLPIKSLSFLFPSSV